MPVFCLGHGNPMNAVSQMMIDKKTPLQKILDMQKHSFYIFGHSKQHFIKQVIRF
jgi:hypothetical protein